MWKIINEAGWPIYPLLLASIISVALIIERIVALRKSKVLPPKLLPEVLTLYKGQHHDESRFRNMNQLPIRVRPLWLKRPDRIETLIFLVMLAVLIYALVERQVHRHIAQTGQKIEGVMPEKRDTFTPSGLRLLAAFAGVCLVRWNDGQRVRVQVSDLSVVQRQILTAIGLADLPARVTHLPQQARALDLLAQA